MVNYQKVNEIMKEIKVNKPLIHNITNYVTATDCANIILAVGGSPAMADEAKEVEEMVSLAGALVLNLGTLNTRYVEAMEKAAAMANHLGVPIVMDPVAVGATSYRNQVATMLLKKYRMTIIRGNLSEMGYLAGADVTTKGVDVSEEDKNLDALEVGKMVSHKYGCVAVVTGEVDLIVDSEGYYEVHNGHPMMAEITGTGCMTTAVMGAFAAVGNKAILSALGGILLMTISGEYAYEQAKEKGLGTFHQALFDGAWRISQQKILLEEKAKVTYEKF